MGSLLSWLKTFWSQEMEIAVLGLQNAGKSTLVQALKNGEFMPDMIPTVGFNMYKVSKGKVEIKVWDLGGQKKFRSMWERYCRGVDAILFVVDSADKDKFNDAKLELHGLLDRHTLESIPLLILANKNDLKESLAAENIAEELELDKLSGNREVAIYSISCKELVNIDITLEWLIKHSKS
jgi:ADP-ribosylation factor-like protein 8